MTRALETSATSAVDRSSAPSAAAAARKGTLPRIVEELETPSLTVDLDAVERNIRRMQAHCDAHELALRPHVKTHKLPLLAHEQIRAGARGIACQKLAEAEVMAAAGITDIMITFPLIGVGKAERLARLASEATIAVVMDSERLARDLSHALAEREASAAFLVECDIGRWRAGVQTPQDALDLARFGSDLPGLRFAGLMTHPTPDGSGQWFEAALAEFERAGIRVDTISIGGTPTAMRAKEIAGMATELRVGTYVYGDRACMARGDVPLEDCAQRVLASVVSRPTSERAILDAGSKSLTNDPAEGVGDGLFGLVVEHPDAGLSVLSEEHGHLDVSRCDPAPALGDVVTILPNHACGATNLHERVVLHRGGSILGEVPIAARGAVR